MQKLKDNILKIGIVVFSIFILINVLIRINNNEYYKNKSFYDMYLTDIKSETFNYKYNGDVLEVTKIIPSYENDEIQNYGKDENGKKFNHFRIDSDFYRNNDVKQNYAISGNNDLSIYASQKMDLYPNNIVHYDKVEFLVKNKKDNSEKRYDLTNLFNEKMPYNINLFCGFKEYQKVGVFYYKGDLFIKFKVDEMQRDNYLKGDFSPTYNRLREDYVMESNEDLTSTIINKERETIFINLDKKKLYQVDEELYKRKLVKNPYQNVLEKNNIDYDYCGLDSNQKKYQLKMSYVNNKDFKEKVGSYKYVININKENFNNVLTLITNKKNLNYKGIIIDKKYSVDNKEHIINSKEEFKRYVKC